MALPVSEVLAKRSVIQTQPSTVGPVCQMTIVGGCTSLKLGAGATLILRSIYRSKQSPNEALKQQPYPLQNSLPPLFSNPASFELGLPTMRIYSSFVLGLACAATCLADCCVPERDCVHPARGYPTCSKCYDGSESTPCCGQGSCNVFCCNCDGGPLPYHGFARPRKLTTEAAEALPQLARTK